MLFDLKPLTREAIPKALEKAERYRLLNEPGEAESICLDVLEIDKENQQALIILLLAMTDQFDKGSSIHQAREVLPRIRDEYLRCYYAGIICERRAKALLDQGGPGAGYAAYEWFQQAMDWYQKGEAIRPGGNDDAILRWNTCARIIMQHKLEPAPQSTTELPLE